MDEWADHARMIEESAAAVVPADGNLERIRRLRFQPPGFDRAVMRQMAEMGWLLLRVDEDAGGLGLGMREMCALMRVMGRGLVPEPLLSSMVACSLLRDALPAPVLAGEAVLVTAWQDRANTLSWRGGAVQGALSGSKVLVPGAEGADLFAVTTSQGIALVEKDAAGLRIDTVETQDGCRVSTLTFDGIAADFLPLGDVDRMLDEMILAQSAYLLGISERALEITLEHLRVREQFGRPIGSFQALQHRATEMKIRLELSRAGIFATARRLDEGVDGAARAVGVSRCKVGAATLAMLVAREAVQMHGAMGVTDEADIGLFVRKAMTEANRFGSARLHRLRLAERIEGLAA